MIGLGQAGLDVAGGMSNGSGGAIVPIGQGGTAPSQPDMLAVEYSYDAWGNVLSVTGNLASTVGAANPYRYRGYRYDEETGLYYLQSRYYDPKVARFINADAIPGAGQGLTRYNLFAYALNNPVRFADYTGESPEEVLRWGWSAALVASQLDSPVPGPGDVVGLAIGLGATIVAGCMLIPWDQVGAAISQAWDWLKNSVSTSATTKQQSSAVLADQNIRATVKKNSQDQYWKAALIGVILLGQGISFDQAVAEVMAGRSVFTTTRANAYAVALAAGGGLKPEFDEMHKMEPGYYNHFHIYALLRFRRTG